MRTDLSAAREELSAALDRYTELCLKIRNTHHQGLFEDTHIAGFPWPEVASELSFFPLLEARLQGAMHNLVRAHDLGRARSGSDYPPPIDKLPDEILAWIFHLAVLSEPRSLDLTGKQGARTSPRLPDSIACGHIFTLLRIRRTLAQPVIMPSHTHNEQGNLSLELHITDIEGQMEPDLGSNKSDWQQFLASIAPRTKSLEINRGDSAISGIGNETFAGILQGCSELFTRLVVHSDMLGSGHIEPLNPDDDEEYWGPGTMKADLSREQIERGLEHLTVLHASQIYP
ncbi:hypothetical protein FRC11_014645 [Ceratobasidium sp. 423]|nr:hypothetical protein FRC11_014645 [Ceratobasidium sp. 423]